MQIGLITFFIAQTLVYPTGIEPAQPQKNMPQQEAASQESATNDAVSEAELPAHPEASPYDEKADAAVAVAAAQARAAATGKRVIVVMGANWCHDSRALAGWFETPRFASMLSPKYEIVYVDAGVPQRKGQSRNQDIVKRAHGKKQQGTPYVMVMSPDGTLLNRDDARSWRNAASRSGDEIYGFFDGFTSN